MVWKGVIGIEFLTGMAPAFTCPDKSLLRIRQRLIGDDMNLKLPTCFNNELTHTMLIVMSLGLSSGWGLAIQVGWSLFMRRGISWLL